MPRSVLNDEMRFSIREMRRCNPRMPYRKIAALFGISNACVCITINSAPAEREEPKPVQREIVPPGAKYSSCIRPIPIARLMAGR